MSVSVFIGTSVDGFIARPNGVLDILLAGGGEPHGHDEFKASVDAIGPKTFETVLTLAAWPYGDKRSRRPEQPARRLNLRRAEASWSKWPDLRPTSFSKLRASGAHHLSVDGGFTIQEFLHAGLIQPIIITRVPVLIGDGIPHFSTLQRDIQLRHVATQYYPSGLAKTEYHVAA